MGDNLFAFGVAPSELRKMPYFELKYYNDAIKRIVDARKKQDG